MPGERPQSPEFQNQINVAEKTVASEKHPERNEDQSLVIKPKNGGIDGLVMGVFDGMGGHGGGDIASRTARTAVNIKLANITNESDPQTIRTLLRDAIVEANNAINAQNASNKIDNVRNENTFGYKPKPIDMGSSGCVGIVKNGSLYVANAADSRCYVLRANGKLECITVDNAKATNADSSMQQRLANVSKISDLGDDYSELALAFHGRNLVNNCLGAKSGGGAVVNPVIYETAINAGDRVFFTSDGIHDNLTDKEIRDIVKLAPNTEIAMARLVNQAQNRAKLGSQIEDHLWKKISQQYPNYSQSQLEEIFKKERLSALEKGGATIRAKMDDITAVGLEIPQTKVQGFVSEQMPTQTQIATAKTFDELFAALRTVQSIQGSKETFTPEQLIKIINDYRNGNLELDYITNGGMGIRDKVRSLLANDISVRSGSNYGKNNESPRPPEPVSSLAKPEIAEIKQTYPLLDTVARNMLQEITDKAWYADGQGNTKYGIEVLMQNAGRIDVLAAMYQAEGKKVPDELPDRLKQFYQWIHDKQWEQYQPNIEDQETQLTQAVMEIYIRANRLVQSEAGQRDKKYAGKEQDMKLLKGCLEIYRDLTNDIFDRLIHFQISPKRLTNLKYITQMTLGTRKHKGMLARLLSYL